MSTALKIRIILDSEEADIFRDIVVGPEENLSHLAQVVIASFDIDAGEISSFYLSDENWEQGEEIPMMDMGMSEEPTLDMEKVIIGSALGNPGQRLLFVYDFIAMWTFYVESIEPAELDEGMELPYVSLTVGDAPDTAPKKNFEGEAGKTKGMFDDAFGSNMFEDEDEDYGTF